MEVSDGRRIPYHTRQQGDEGQHHQHHVCGRCGYPFPNPHPSAKHRRAHKKHCGKIEGYILDASGKTNAADKEEDHSGETMVLNPELEKGKEVPCLRGFSEGGWGSSNYDAASVYNLTKDTSNSGYLPEDTLLQDKDMAVTAEKHLKDSESHNSVPLCKDQEGNCLGKSNNFSSKSAADGCSCSTNADEVHNGNDKTDEQHSDPACDSSTAELQVEEMNENSGIETTSDLSENAIGIHENLPDSNDNEVSHAEEETTENSVLNAGTVTAKSSSLEVTTKFVQVVTESAQSEQQLEDENIKCTKPRVNPLAVSPGKHRSFEDHDPIFTSSMIPVNLEEKANISLTPTQLEKNDESRDAENGIATKMLQYDESLHATRNFDNLVVGDVVSKSSLPDRIKVNNNINVIINESSEAEEITCSYPEADSFELDAAPTKPETLEEGVLLKVEQIMPENKVTEPNTLVQARQLATHEDVEAHGHSNSPDTIDENRGMTHAVDNLEPTYTSSESAVTNYMHSYPITMGNKSAPDVLDPPKSVKETFKEHTVKTDVKVSTLASTIEEITNEKFEKREDKVCTIPDETNREEHLHGEDKEDSYLSSNNPVMKLNFRIVESETEDAVVPPNKNLKTKVTIKTVEEKECVLHGSIIPDTSKIIRTPGETTVGVSEQSLTNEVLLAKDQQLDAAVVIINTSADTSSQSDSVEEKERVLHGSIIPDTSKIVRTPDETIIGISEQSLINEVLLAKDQQLDVTDVIIDTSVDTGSRSDSVEGQWGSVSDVSHGFRTLQASSRGETEMHNQAELHSELTGNTSNKEPSSEIQVSQKPHKISEANNRDEEIVTKVVNWDSGNSHTPLRNLLVQATRESKQKAGNSTILPNPSTTTNAEKTKARASIGSPTRKVDDHGEWNSPARLPVRKNDKRYKAKSSWLPFICCPSLN